MPYLFDATKKTICGISYFGALLWTVSIFMMISSSFRSWNIGYQKETYILSTLCQLPILYNAWSKNDRRVMMTNCFYFANGLFAIYRW